MKKTIFKDLPAAPNKNRPGGRQPVTYVWLTKPGTEVEVGGVPMGLVYFRRAW